ncbi:MAG: NAD(P)H-dependent oxidoreductase subunit E [Parcubacteria group bacterium]|jgi:NADH-quinone oxidoreductase subunit E
MMTVEKILLEFDPEIKNLLPALKKISAGFGYISQNDAQKLAEYFSVPLSRVFETASFYDEIKTKKQPDLVIQVCSSVNCAVSKSFEIVSKIEDYFKIKAGDEFDQKVRLEVMSCLGQCGEGPVVVVNDKVYTNVTKSSVAGVLEEWA